MSFLLFGNAYCQTKPIYVINSRYNEQLNDLIKTSDIDFREIKILVNYQLVNSNNSNVVDYNRVEMWINKLFPNENDEGVLCVDLENKYYEDLKGNNITRAKMVGSSEFDEAINEFVKLAKFIKQKRPNIKMGFYGMPFKLFEKSELRESAHQNLDPILEVTDIIFPSYYLPYPAKTKGIEANYEFLKTNLDQTFSYADRLNKPVITLFWYLVYSPDRNLRFERIPRNEMSKYIEYIENYKSPQGSGTFGLFWWDTPTSYSQNHIKKNFLSRRERRVNSTIEDVFMSYFNLQGK